MLAPARLQGMCEQSRVVGGLVCERLNGLSRSGATVALLGGDQQRHWPMIKGVLENSKQTDSLVRY